MRTGVRVMSAVGGGMPAWRARSLARAVGALRRRREVARLVVKARDQRADRFAAMRELVLALERKLGTRQAGLRVEKMRVVAESPGAARLVDDRSVPGALRQDRLGIV